MSLDKTSKRSASLVKLLDLLISASSTYPTSNHNFPEGDFSKLRRDFYTESVGVAFRDLGLIEKEDVIRALAALNGRSPALVGADPSEGPEPVSVKVSNELLGVMYLLSK